MKKKSKLSSSNIEAKQVTVSVRRQISDGNYGSLSLELTETYEVPEGESAKSVRKTAISDLTEYMRKEEKKARAFLEKE